MSAGSENVEIRLLYIVEFFVLLRVMDAQSSAPQTCKYEVPLQGE